MRSTARRDVIGAILLEIIIKIVAYLFVDVLIILTGEAILYVISFGRIRPDWRGFNARRAEESVMPRFPAFWVGAAAWMGVFLALFIYLMDS